MFADNYDAFGGHHVSYSNFQKEQKRVNYVFYPCSEVVSKSFREFGRHKSGSAPEALRAVRGRLFS